MKVESNSKEILNGSDSQRLVRFRIGDRVTVRGWRVRQDRKSKTRSNSLRGTVIATRMAGEIPQVKVKRDGGCSLWYGQRLVHSLRDQKPNDELWHRAESAGRNTINL